MATEKPDQLQQIPPIKQQIAAQIIADKVRKQEKIVMAKVLEEAGYSKGIQNQPSRMMKTKSWQQLLESKLKESFLLKKHKQLINSSGLNHYTFPNAMTDQEITKIILDGVPGAKVINIHRNQQWARAHFSAPDNQTQLKSLELAYKVSGKLKSETEAPNESEEIREVIFRVRKLLPQAGQ